MTGVQRYAYQLLIGLLQAAPDMRFRVYTLPSQRLEEALIIELRQAGAEVISGPAWARNKQVFEQVALPRMASRDGAFRLLHLSNSLSVASRVRQICFLYDLAPIRLPDTYRLAYRAKFGTVLQAARLRKPQVATLSEFSRRELESQHVAVSVVVAAGEGSPMLARLALGADGVEVVPDLELLPDRFALVLGSSDPRKRVAEVIASWGPVHERLGLSLVVVEGASALHRRAQAGDDPPGVLRLAGRVSDRGLVSLARRSSLAIFASRYEGGALAAQELLALGTPVVASDIPTFRELLPIRVPFFSDPADLGDRCAQALDNSRPVALTCDEAAASWRVAANQLLDQTDLGLERRPNTSLTIQ